MNRPYADVLDGRIVVFPTFADTWVIAKIPEGRWDGARSAWSFPATERHAETLRERIAKLATTDAFEALLHRPATEAAPTPAPAPAAEQPEPLSEFLPVGAPPQEIVVELPPGLKTSPWRHQKAAFKFCIEHFAIGMHGVLLAMGMGCVEGDAEIIVNRGGGGRRMTLREFHRKFHGGESNKRRWKEAVTRTRSLIGAELHLNRVEDVIARGVRPVMRITLASGKSVRVTPDHEIACPGGRWVAAGNLKPGDVVLTNGTPACKTCGSTQRVTTYRYAVHVGICRSCIGRLRSVKGKCIDKDGYVRLYGMHGHPRANKAGQVYEHIVVMERVLGRPIPPSEHVHHKNHIRHDNRPENLEVLPAQVHYRHHGKSGGYLHLDGEHVQFVPKPDEVVSVEPDGETDVYDIRMAAPGHNFVANGIIVHNCGKTLVAFLLMLHLKARRVMIVAPLRVVQVWLAQIGVHVGIDVLVVALDEEVGSVAQKQQLAEEKMRLAATMGVPFIVVINYDSAWREPFASWAERFLWDLIIADEAHRMKSPSGRASKWFKRMRIHARYRVALTGTPLPHGPMDAFALFRFLDVGIFGTAFTAFRARYAVMGGYQRKQITGYQNMEDFEARLSKATFRVGKEVLTLPPEMDVTYYCELGPEGRRVYRDVKRDCFALVEGGIITASNAMVAVLRLAQVANGIGKTDDGQEIRVDDSKRKLLEDTMQDIGGEEPIVVFTRFHLDLDAVHEACRANGYSSLELSGRRDELRQWQDGKAQVLAVQISAGGVGVDLTRARYSIYYSIGFALADYMQARSRVHRPGQTRPVEHIHLLAKGTVDVKIMTALEKRAEVIEAILAEIRN